MNLTKRSVPFVGILTLLCWLVYSLGLSGPLFFDDKPALTANELVQLDGDTFDEWRAAALSSNSGLLRRPISMLSFAANHALSGGFSSSALKTVNLLIHFSVAGLLFLLFDAVLASLKIFPSTSTCHLVALTATALWVLHPLHVSTVLYAVQRMAQLSALFIVAGLLVFVRYRQRWAEVGSSFGEVFAAGLWLTLITTFAVLSKESGALLPWLVAVLEVCVFRGVWAGRENKALRTAGWLCLLLPMLLVLALLGLNSATLIGGYAWREFTLEERLFTQARMLWRYLGWICLPNINDMGFQHDDIPLSTGLFSPLSTALSVAAWLVLITVSLLLRQRFPLLLLGILFYLVGHSMESTVIPLEMVYEHRNYLPSIFICLGLASVLVVPAVQGKRINVWYPVLGVLAIWSLLLLVRVQTWSDELTLSRVNLEQHPASSRSNYFYANALLRHYRSEKDRDSGGSEAAESLLLSRHYFERMYQTNERDVAALVMLYYLDSHFFTALQEQTDWLEQLEQLLATRTLQASDWNALALFFEVVDSGAEAVGEARVLGILDKLAQRYPRSSNVLRYRYQYLSAADATPQELLPLLRQAQAMSPGASWIYYALLTEQLREPDVAGMYESARQWLLHDPQRYQINQVKSLFGATDTVAGEPNE